MVRHFDVAFRLREEYPESPILLCAMGVLFKITRPEPEVGRIAQSSITQALLSEPGAAQKAFALLSFWHINGFSLNTTLIHDTICRMIFRHQWRGATSDVAWALAFCLEQGMLLNKSTARVLSRFDDDCILLQALHLHSAGLLPSGFSSSHIEKRIKDADLDREHWLLSYETARHGFLNASLPAVSKHPLFADLLAKKVSFYRTRLPLYASVVHPGGAPERTVRVWLNLLKKPPTGEGPPTRPEGQVFALLEHDVARLPPIPATVDETRESLIDIEMKESGETPELPEHSDVFD
jgi:hypothetical protein